MDDTKILKFIDRFRFIYKRLGIDYESMRTILKLKFLLDSRRVPTIYKDRENKGNAFKKSLYLYAFIGVFMMLMIFLPGSMILKMSINIGGIMFLIMTTMISDFSSVLLNVKDRNILNTKPLDSKTINAAKTTHILIYITSITVAIGGPTLIGGLIKYKFKFFIIFFIEMILLALFTIFFTSILYYFILKFFDGEKLKDVINYFQIVLSVVMVIMYQIIPRVFDFSSVNMSFTPKWWSYLIPPVWFASPFSLIIEGNTGLHYITLSIVSVVVPITIFLIYYKFITPYFEKNLQKLENSTTQKGKEEEIKGEKRKKFASIFCKGNVENVFFRFTRNMMATERELKLKIYPNLALAVVLPFIFFISAFSNAESFSKVIDDFSNGDYYFSIYIAILILASNIQFLMQSEKYKAAWIYYTLPVDKPGKIKKGAVKGFACKNIIPIFFIMCIIFLLICGIRILPDLLIMFFSMLILIAASSSMFKVSLPFYTKFDNKGDIEATLLILLFLGLLFGIHFVLRIVIKNSFVIYGYLVLLFLLSLLTWKKSFNEEWKDILNTKKK